MTVGMEELYRGETGTPRQRVALRERINWMCAQSRGHRVLDVGCAGGAAVILLAREGYEVVGIDRDPEAIERGRRARADELPAVAERIDLVLADVLDRPELGRFDTIMLGHVLDELVQPEQALSAAADYLNEAGRLVVTVPFGVIDAPWGRQAFHPHRLMDLLQPAWRVDEPIIRNGSMRLVAARQDDDQPLAERWQAPASILISADAAQRELESHLIEEMLDSGKQLRARKAELDESEEAWQAFERSLRGTEKEREALLQRLEGLESEVSHSTEVLAASRTQRREQQERLRELSVEQALLTRRLALAERTREARAEDWGPMRDDALRERQQAERATGSLLASRRHHEAVETENQNLRRLRGRMDQLLDRVAPSPGWPSSRLEDLLRRHDKLRRMQELVEDGVRRKIGDAFVRAARPSLDTLLLPARLVSLFAEGRRKEQARKGRPALARGDRSGAKPAPAPVRPAVEQGAPQPKNPDEVAPARPLLGWPDAEPGQRLCIYAEVNANLIDGSSIWLASLVETLAADPALRLTVLLGQPIERPEVIGHLGEHPRIRWVTADDLARAGWLTDLVPRRRRLEPEQAVEALAALDRIAPQSLFIVRGPGIFEGEHLLDSLVARESLAQRSWAYLVDPAAYDRPERQRNLQRVAAACRRIVCQTPEAQQALAASIPAAPDAVLVLPPMIPAVEAQPRRLRDATRPRLGYAGKLSPPYRILEMLDAIERIRRQRAGAELHVIGDKIHNAPPLPGFEQQVKTRLRETPGVVWHGGVSRARTIALLDQTDVASSWRDASFDDSLELSTKVLEYAALGLPVLLNPTPLQRSLFGDDYPGYVLSAEDLVERFRRLTAEPEFYHEVSAQVLAVARRYTFAEALAGLQSWLQRDMQAAAAGTATGAV